MWYDRDLHVFKPCIRTCADLSMQQRFEKPERRLLLLLQARRVHLRQQPFAQQLSAVRNLVESIKSIDEAHLLCRIAVVAVGVEAAIAAEPPCEHPGAPAG